MWSFVHHLLTFAKQLQHCSNCFTQLCEADIFSVQIYQAVEIAKKSIVRPRPWPQLGATVSIMSLASE